MHNVTVIAAMSEKGRVIGSNGKLPWTLLEDLRRFKALTTGHVIIMGRKTWESIGCRPLPSRVHIVLTRDKARIFEGAIAVNNIKNAIEKAATISGDGKSIYVIGGAEIYRLAIPFAKRMELTWVHGDDIEGDAHFPSMDTTDGWVTLKREYHARDNKNSHSFTFETLVRFDTAKCVAAMREHQKNRGESPDLNPKFPDDLFW